MIKSISVIGIVISLLVACSDTYAKTNLEKIEGSWYDEEYYNQIKDDPPRQSPWGASADVEGFSFWKKENVWHLEIRMMGIAHYKDIKIMEENGLINVSYKSDRNNKIMSIMVLKMLENNTACVVSTGGMPHPYLQGKKECWIYKRFVPDPYPGLWGSSGRTPVPPSN